MSKQPVGRTLPTPGAQDDEAIQAILDAPTPGVFPTKQRMSAMSTLLEAAGRISQFPRNALQFAKDRILRTDGFNVDEHLASLDRLIASERDSAERRNLEALKSRTESVSDLTSKLYKSFADNPNSMAFWLPPLVEGLEQCPDSPFRVPRAKVLRLPVELAQFIRLEYQDTNQVSRDAFNQFLFEAFGLEDDREYFIKTGTFSSKFEFANVRCAEPREMGEYFQVVNNFAMQVGAGRTVDLVVREFVEDPDEHPTIYHGMPLRTEFRAFVDFDHGDDPRVLGVTPYWHPSVMEQALAFGAAQGLPYIRDDYETYMGEKPRLLAEFAEYRPQVTKGLRDLLAHVKLSGQWSVDVMLSGGKLYLIDMALMAESALVDVLKTVDEFCDVPPQVLDRLVEHPGDPGPATAWSAPLYDSEQGFVNVDPKLLPLGPATGDSGTVESS